MTAPAQYQPPPPKSSRTIGWAIGRAIVWLVYAFVVFAIILATLAFFLQLLGASPTSDFASWVYRGAARVTAPFRGIFPTHALTDDSYLDVSLLFAIIMYGIFALVISELMSWLDRKRDASVQHDLYNEQQAEAMAAAPAPAPANSRRSQKRTASA